MENTKLNNELLKKPEDADKNPKRNSKQELINKIVQVSDQNEMRWNYPTRNSSV